MKVNIGTVELVDDELFAIGVAKHGNLQLASRDEVREFFISTTRNVLSEAAEEIGALRSQLVQSLNI